MGILFIFKFKTKRTSRFTVIALVIAIVAAVFGFGNIVPGIITISKIVFFIFSVLFLLSLIGESRSEND